jgi:hypothetical protein
MVETVHMPIAKGVLLRATKVVVVVAVKTLQVQQTSHLVLKLAHQ